MAEIPPGAQQGQAGPPQIDIGQLMRMYDPKQLQMLGQALTSLLKVQAALTPPPDPREQMAQPGYMEQLAMIDLQRRRQAMMQQQQAAMAQGPPRPMGMPM